MTAGDGFRVAIKDSARRVVDGDSLTSGGDANACMYPSRSAAEAALANLDCTEAGRLELQAPAPNDPADVDAYLVFYPEDRKREPDGSPDDGWTFDTTANQYGAIGEALVTAPGIPALDHFVRRDLAGDVDAEGAEHLQVDCVTRPKEFDWATLQAAVEGTRPGWTPDCEVRVSLPRRRGFVHRYFCEIKTGDASFERNQAADMESVAAVADVLQIRVTVDELPDEYSVKFTRVGDSRPDLDVALPGPSVDPAAGDQAGLSDFLD